MAPTVSVVIAAYNEERWIGVCLGSLARQTLRAEVVVVDDGSRDATAAIAARYPVTLLRTRHRGCGAARDHGARHASGDALVFLDADEVYAPDFLERLVAPLADPAVHGTFPGSVTRLNPGEGLAPGWLRVRGTRPRTELHFTDPHHIAKAVRRSDFLRVGGYPHVGYGEDQAFSARIGPATVVPEARWQYTLPTGAREIFAKSRWIGRGPLFARQRPALRRLLPPHTWRRAVRHLRARRPRAALVQVLYETGLLVGYLESRVVPGLRHRA